MQNGWMLLLGMVLIGCQPSAPSASQAKAQIVATLEQETRFFCARDLEGWQAQWSHRPFVSKMYAGDTEFEEFVGWEEVRQHTVDHLQAFSDPIPLPAAQPSYTVELFGPTALVFYHKQGPSGPVREIRFMIREGSKWKIARMETIY